jgi:hypothetical protein
MMYFPYSLNYRNYACTEDIHQLSALCFVFSAAHAAPSNNRINSDWQFRYAPLPAGYAVR